MLLCCPPQIWAPRGPNLGLSGWVSMTAKSGESLLERVPVVEAEQWKMQQKQRVLEQGDIHPPTGLFDHSPTPQTAPTVPLCTPSVPFSFG
eukprot:COSAG01_NODE_4248_length_5208_cov_15.724408_5_plen_91_part_00